MGPHAATGFPVQYVNQPVAYHPQQAAHLPLQEGGGMPRHDGQPLPIGGQHIQMGGGGQHPMQMQMGGMPMQFCRLRLRVPANGDPTAAATSAGAALHYPASCRRPQVLIRFHTRASVNLLLCYRVLSSSCRVTLSIS